MGKSMPKRKAKASPDPPASEQPVVKAAFPFSCKHGFPVSGHWELSAIQVKYYGLAHDEILNWDGKQASALRWFNGEVNANEERVKRK